MTAYDAKILIVETLEKELMHYKLVADKKQKEFELYGPDEQIATAYSYARAKVEDYKAAIEWAQARVF